MAKKRRTKVPVGGWFVKYNAGNVEYNNKVFNAATNASESPSTNPTGPMGERLETEANNIHQYTLGSNKQLQAGTAEYNKIQDLANALTSKVKDGKTHFEVEDCYEDYGADMMWTTIICYYPANSKQGMSHYQVLSSKDWIDYMNGTISAEELAAEIDKEQGHRWNATDDNEHLTENYSIRAIFKHLNEDND